MKRFVLVRLSNVLLAGVFFTLTASAALTTNIWNDGNGSWQTPGNWTLGAPPSLSGQSAVLISTGVNNTVTIDTATSTNISTMTISNLILRGNTLQLNNAIVTTFHIINQLTLTNSANLLVTNSAIQADGSLSVISTGSKATIRSLGTLSLGGGNLEVNFGGNLTVIGGSAVLSNLSLGGPGGIGTGQVWVTGGGTLTVGPNTLLIGSGGTVGQLTVTSATLRASTVQVPNGVSPNFSFMQLQVGGLIAIDNTLSIGSFPAGGVGVVQIAAGTLAVTNTLLMGSGTLSIFNATVSIGSLFMSNANARIITSSGTFTSLGSAQIYAGRLTVDGGTNNFLSNFQVGVGPGLSIVAVNGGRLVVTNGTTTIGGVIATSVMTLSNCSFLARDIILGNTSGNGTLTALANSAANLSSNLTLGGTSSTGTVWVAGGDINVTNAGVTTVVGDTGIGNLTLSNGTLRTCNLVVGRSGGFGIVTVQGGALLVTNCSLTDIRRGTLTLNGGVFATGTLLATNSLGSLVVNGGLLISSSTTISNGQNQVVNNATFNTAGGVHTFNNGLRIETNATLAGCGTINGNILVLGNVQATCGSTMNFTGTVTNNANITTFNGTALNFFGPVVNNGLINGTNGSVHFFSTLVNNGTILQSISVSPTNLAFGNQAVGTASAQSSVTVSNNGSSSLSISNITFTGANAADFGVASDTCTGSLIPTGSVCTIGVVFSPTATGARAATLNIFNNSGISPATVPVSGTGITSSTNSWIDGNGKWETGANWSLGVAPTNSHAAIAIANAGNNVVTIDSITVTGITGATSMIISNLIITSNTLAMVNASLVTPLQIIEGSPGTTGLRINSGGSLVISNSILKIRSQTPYVDGSLLLDGGFLVQTNPPVGNTFYVGLNAPGQLTLRNGTAVVESMRISSGTFTMGAGTNLVNERFENFGTAWINGGSLVCTGAVGELRSLGQTTVSNGTVRAKFLEVGFPYIQNGSLTMNGGTMLISSSLLIGSATNGLGRVTVAGGSLYVTNASVTGVTDVRFGTLVLTGGLFCTDILLVTNSHGSFLNNGGTFCVNAQSQVDNGTQTVSSGTTVITSNLVAGSSAGTTGTVLIAGGQLVATNNPIEIGQSGWGLMNITSGAVQALIIKIGSSAGGGGSLTMSGGSVNILSNFLVASAASTTGTVVMSGGTNVVNGSIIIGSNGGRGRVILSTGAGPFSLSKGGGIGIQAGGGGSVLKTRTALLGTGSEGTLTVANGEVNIYSNLVVGDCGLNATGFVEVTGGNLFVTNTTQTAFLDVRNGTVTLSAGLLKVDKLVMTNTCGRFVRTGGTLVIGSTLLDPDLDADGDGIPNGYEQDHGLDPFNAADASADSDGDGYTNLQEYQAGTNPSDPASSLFRITAIERQSNDVLVTWTTIGGRVYVVQTNAPTANGNYTNNFADLSAPTAVLTTGSFSYGDVGGATNNPARYYRVKSMTATALDNAADAAYNGGWTNGSNGGMGFGPWTLTASGVIGSGTNGYFIGSSTNNAAAASPGIDVAGKSWGIYANTGNLTAAYRALAGGPLLVGQSLLINLDNGFIDPGSADGFVLRNGNANSAFTDYNVGARFEFLFLGGTNNYAVVDNAGLQYTSVPFTGTGLRLKFTLTGANTYTLQTIINATSVTNSTSGTLAGSGSVDSIAIYNRNAGAGGASDAFFNSLQIISP